MAVFFKSWEEAEIRIPMGKTTGKYYQTCPKCSHTRKHNKQQKCLDVNLDRKAFKCFNNCGFEGFISNVEKRTFDVPTELPKVENPISQEWAEFFFKRGISIQTLRKLGCQVTEIAFPQDMVIENEKQVWIKSSAVSFPYRWKGKLLFYKYRGLKKQMASSKNPQYIPFNLDCMFEEGKAKKLPYLIWVEGEIDVATFVECGYSNAISVPNGATKGTINMDWFDRVVHLLDSVETHYIATDDDECGTNLRAILTRRLGKENCKNILFPFQNKKGEKSKDINEVLEAHSPKEVKWCFDNAKENPIDGVKDPKDYKDLLDDVFENGRKPFARVGFQELDNIFTWNTGNALTVISAKPHSAKSQLVFNICIRLSYLHGMKWAIFSPETGEIDEIVERLVEIFTGGVLHNSNKWKLLPISKSVYDFAYEFISKHFMIYCTDELESFELKDYLDIAANLVKKKGINGFVIDPFNDLDNAFGGGEMMANALNENLKMAKRFAKKHDSHVILVPHPTSLRGVDRMDDPYQINGGAAWNNKCDNILLMNRIGGTGDWRMGEGDNIEILVKKCKKAFAGTRGEITLAYHVPTGRFGNILPTGAGKFENYTDFERVVQQGNGLELKLEEKKDIYEHFETTEIQNFLIPPITDEECPF